MSQSEKPPGPPQGPPAKPPSGSLSRDARPLVRDDPIRAVIWITVAMALFAVLAAASRKAALMGMHPLQVVFLRNLSAALFMMPLLIWRGRALLRSNALHLYGVRVAISVFSMTAWFYALALIPVAEVTAIGFLAPLFGTIGAVLILREKIRFRRMTALLVGVVGAMIILRTGSEPIGLGQACAIFNAISSGVMTVLLKQLSSEDDSAKIVFLTTIMMLPPTLVPESLLEELSRRYTLLLLSNTNAIHYRFLERHYAHIGHFHHHVLSHEAGAQKPARKIYDDALAAAGVKPEEVFFTDDLEENIGAARRLGIDAEVFTGVKDLLTHLAVRGISPGEVAQATLSIG